MADEEQLRILKPGQRCTMPKFSRIVSYTRVSTDQQGRSGLGLEAQREAVRRFAESENLEILAERSGFERGHGNPSLAMRSGWTRMRRNPDGLRFGASAAAATSFVCTSRWPQTHSAFGMVTC
jgi:hypothetical protein